MLESGFVEVEEMAPPVRHRWQSVRVRALPMGGAMDSFSGSAIPTGSGAGECLLLVPQYGAIQTELGW